MTPPASRACAEDWDVPSTFSPEDLPNLRTPLADLPEELQVEDHSHVRTGSTPVEDAEAHREGARARQAKSRRKSDPAALARALATREKDRRRHQAKRDREVALMQDDADDQFARHRNKEHVETRLESDCWVCWLLARDECQRTHGYRAEKEWMRTRTRPVKASGAPGSVFDVWPHDIQHEKDRILSDLALPFGFS
jgi:hypothetical protein